MAHPPLRSLAATVALALPSVLGCDSSPANSPSGPSGPGSIAPPAAASAARNTGLSHHQQEVLDALKAYEAAIVASDTVTLKRIWHEDYTFINPQGGLMTRAHRLANIASGATNVVEGVNQRELMIRVYGDNAVVTQLFTLRGLYSGVMTDREVRGSFTWIKRAGRWQLVFNNVTPVLP